MDNQTINQTEDQNQPIEIDSWEKAFAALEPKSTQDDTAVASDGDAGNGTAGIQDPGANDGEQKVPDLNEAGNPVSSEAVDGGLDSDVGISDEADGSSAGSVFGISGVDIEQYREKLDKDIRDRTLSEIAKEFIKRGVRNTDGVIGATIDDEDICKRDEDGVRHFYNPETGKEFYGSNPRREAQEWVDDYNREIARLFNKACLQYEQHLKQEAEPGIKVMEFAPKYNKLDAIRKGMFDNVIQDYEIKDDAGKVVGYSCDLDKALALVERQITMIQSYAKQHKQSQPQAQQQQTGPALDMKTSSGAMQGGEQKEVQSLAEAMERLQDMKLQNLKK